MDVLKRCIQRHATGAMKHPVTVEDCGPSILGQHVAEASLPYQAAFLDAFHDTIVAEAKRDRDAGKNTLASLLADRYAPPVHAASHTVEQMASTGITPDQPYALPEPSRLAENVMETRYDFHVVFFDTFADHVSQHHADVDLDGFDTYREQLREMRDAAAAVWELCHPHMAESLEQVESLLEQGSTGSCP